MIFLRVSILGWFSEDRPVFQNKMYNKGLKINKQNLKPVRGEIYQIPTMCQALYYVQAVFSHSTFKPPFKVEIY